MSDEEYMPLAVPADSLPTPPYPSNDNHSHTLDALIAHYQRERMWVKQTQDLISIARQEYLCGPSTPPSPSPSNSARIPLWKRRKSRQCLHLSKLSQSTLSPRLLSDGACTPKILDLFAALLDARIESCKRVEYLIASHSAQRRSRLSRHHHHIDDINFETADAVLLSDGSP